ncbi:hypothetical protein [Novosphingobium pentaromativorans]|uniref:Uncharacterized protein n=1 Tax=Novosphingobium pentaromativorans US6-1 TaxID=1088721 RepID=G6EA75_9SPHN|nr:hypothetical protein [Novosphingobium pentaromativorans]AIT80784.1 hypothetical protein JI59_13880 [Novosphingobium pentaromativorans US6-1]EHJ61790.1 hypothetical protein NSU_1246 [Novosphingobium pentaromativorans US6-1]
MRWLFGIFLALYILALLALTAGTLGWLEQDKNALSGLFLTVLGMPWNALADQFGPRSVATTVLAPGVNLAIFGLLAQLFPSDAQKGDERP